MAGRYLSVVDAALHKDCVASLSAAIQQLGLTIHGFCDWNTKRVVQQRNLLSMAAGKRTQGASSSAATAAEGRAVIKVTRSMPRTHESTPWPCCLLLRRHRTLRPDR